MDQILGVGNTDIQHSVISIRNLDMSLDFTMSLLSPLLEWIRCSPPLSHKDDGKDKSMRERVISAPQKENMNKYESSSFSA